MELENSFSVEVPIDRAWEVLTDVPAIAPCLPGAKLTEVDGDDYKGTVKVKVGPIVAEYKGTATFVETDEAARRIVLRAEGRETRGQGNASATITAVLNPDGDTTKVTVHTDMSITGKAAQFGRGVMAEVSAKLMKQFSDNLAETVLGDKAEPGAAAGVGEKAGSAAAAASAAGSSAAGLSAGASSAAGSTPGSPSTAAGSSTGSSSSTQTGWPASGSQPVPPAVSGEPEPIDLLEVAGGATAKRVVPAVVGVVLILLLVRMLIRRRRS